MYTQQTLREPEIMNGSRAHIGKIPSSPVVIDVHKRSSVSSYSSKKGNIGVGDYKHLATV